jgi:frataxin-like iron-binding protein CyaY
MPMPEQERTLAEAILQRYCDEKIPDNIRDQLRLTYTFEDNSFILLEERPPIDSNSDVWLADPVAKFVYKKAEKLWHLLWLGQDLQWHDFSPPERSSEFSRLLDKVDEDVTAIFWG